MLRIIAELARNGRETARVNYGARGWVAHHNADLWRQTAPVGNWGQGDPKWANWPMGAVWHSMDLWEHYAFTRDEAWLRDFAWPLLRGAAEFALDWLVPDGKGGLATAPSFSPENDVPRAATATSAEVSASTTSDLALAARAASRTPSRPRRSSASDAAAAPRDGGRARAAPAVPDRRARPAPGVERGLRGARAAPPPHVAPHRPPPRPQITPAETPALAEAVRRSLELRGDDSTGWSMAWKVNLWARLGDGDRAHRADRLPAPPRRHDGHELRGRRRRLREPLRRPPAVPDRRQLRRDRRRRRDAACSRTAARPDGRAPVVDLLPALPSAWPAGRVTRPARRGAPSRWTSSGRPAD